MTRDRYGRSSQRPEVLFNPKSMATIEQLIREDGEIWNEQRLRLQLKFWAALIILFILCVFW